MSVPPIVDSSAAPTPSPTLASHASHPSHTAPTTLRTTRSPHLGSEGSHSLQHPRQLHTVSGPVGARGQGHIHLGALCTSATRLPQTQWRSRRAGQQSRAGRVRARAMLTVVHSPKQIHQSMGLVGRMGDATVVRAASTMAPMLPRLPLTKYPPPPQFALLRNKTPSPA